MSPSADTPEKRPPALPRRKRSHVSQDSGERSSRSGPSVQEVTCALTPSSGSQQTAVGFSCLANSRRLGFPVDTTEAKSPARISRSEDDLTSKMDDLTVQSEIDDIITKAKIRSFFVDWYEDYETVYGQGFDAWNLFFARYCSTDFVYIRPSGNPLDREGLARMLAVDATVLQAKLVSIDSISIMRGQRSAIVVYTTDQTFDYKGTLNEDRAVVSCILEMREGVIKVIHEHRTSGRPIPKETRWASIE